MPLDGVGEDEGEVALDGLEAGEIVGCDAFEGEFVELREIELGEVDGLAEFAVCGFGCGEFAEVGDGLVVQERGGRAAGLEPGGGFGGECEGGGAAGWGEEGDQGFDGALELEEGWRLCGVSVGCDEVAGEAEGELGGFLDVSDERAIGGDNAGEDLALLEEADVFYVAVEVVGEHVQHAGDERGAEEGGFFGERVLHGDGSVLFCGEEVGVGLRGEGAGDGFAVAESEEAGADGGFFCSGGVAMTGSAVGRVLAKRL